ncbi:MAG TPA: TIGR03619 family F420-dependent LLM class oxidoreductase [Chloroflexota bacterium]|nr:TIGR03619 family F420-dependent LLM class oxidoreductase [Chloroflexota bacterium]
MRFGLILPTNRPEATVQLIRESASLAEELGYDSIWTTDHVMMSRATPTPPYHSIFEALTVMAWMAGVTSKVKIGVSVLVLAQRNPVVVAKEVATIDRISGGRVILGVGTGWHEPEFEFLNADFHKRGRILDESILVLRQLWTEPEKAFRGTFFRFENQAFGPPPAQYGGPPILVGGLTEPALKRAATYGDGWHASRIPPDQFKACVDRLAELNPSRKLPVSLRTNVGTERGHIPDERGGRFIIGGSSADLLDDVRRYQEAGCSEIALSFWEGDVPAYLDQVRRFAGEVMPKV